MTPNDKPVRRRFIGNITKVSRTDLPGPLMRYVYEAEIEGLGTAVFELTATDDVLLDGRVFALELPA
jgi:hypothetical protein